MVNSGNTWRCAISGDLLKRLGLGKSDLRQLPQTKLGTARRGVHLTILGELVRPLKLEVVGAKPQFSFRPIVVDRLAMDVNLSGPWMKHHKWDQIHSSDAIRIGGCLLYTSPSPRDLSTSRMPSSA